MARRTSSTAAANTKRLTVTLRKSTIGFGKKQAAVVEGLGLRRLNHSIEVPDTPAVRGMIHKIRHLVEVAE